MSDNKDENKIRTTEVVPGIFENEALGEIVIRPNQKPVKVSGSATAPDGT